MAHVTITATGDCYECCGVPVDCPDCPSIPTTFLFTIVATGDLAFLDGGEVTVEYAGYSGGFFNWVGTATIGGCDVTVGWGLTDDNTCAEVFGDFSVANCCEAIPPYSATQSLLGGDIATAFSFSCDPPTFTMASRGLWPGGSEGIEGDEIRCFPTGSVSGEAVPV